MQYRKKRRRKALGTVHEVSRSVLSDHFKNKEDSAYAEALVGLLTRSNTILSGRDIQCSLSETVQIAATDGSIIYFNVGQVASLVRGLRIQRRIPTEAEYLLACNALHNGEWQPFAEGESNTNWRHRYGSHEITRQYLFRKYRQKPELFGTYSTTDSRNNPTNFGLLQIPATPYEEFIKLLQRNELSESIKSFASLRGLNYHELSHCLFTPNTNTSLRRSIQNLPSRFNDMSKTGFSCGDDLAADIVGWTKANQQEWDGSLAPAADRVEALRKRRDVDAIYKKLGAKHFRLRQVSRQLQEQGFWHKMWNTLEDQRIESLFVAKFPSARHFFTATVLRYILTHPKSIDHESVKRYAKENGGGEIDTTKKGSAYLLVHGRRYLPKHLRNKYREMLLSDYALSTKAVEEVENLIDAFRSRVNFKNNQEVELATDIVWEFGLWCLRHIEEISLMPEPDGGFSHDTQKETGGQTKRENAEDDERRQQQEKQWEDEEEEEDSSDSDQGDSDSDEEDDSESGDDADDSDDDADNGDSSEESDGDDDSDDDSEDGEESDSSSGSQKRRHQTSDDSDSKQSQSNGKGTKGSSDGLPIDSEIRELLEQSEDQIAEDALKQIDTLHDLVKKERSSRFFRELWKPDGAIEPPVLYRGLSNAISNSLTKLRSDRDNQWEKGSAVGVVNVLRYAEARGAHTDFFDEWQEDGDERPDAELCVLLDLSSSMNTESYASAKAYFGPGGTTYLPMTNATEASCAMWAIKYACQRNEIPCTVIGYSDGAHAALPIYADTDTVVAGTVPTFLGLSGTSPAQAIEIAQSVLEKSDARHRILVSLSDGDWAIHSDGLKPIDALNKLGVQTVFIQLPSRIDRQKGLDGSITPKPIFSWSGFSAEDKVAVNKPKRPYYRHSHLLKAEDSSVLTKQIGAILLQAVANR